VKSTHTCLLKLWSSCECLLLKFSATGKHSCLIDSALKERSIRHVIRRPHLNTGHRRVLIQTSALQPLSTVDTFARVTATPNRIISSKYAKPPNVRWSPSYSSNTTQACKALRSPMRAGPASTRCNNCWPAAF
jgi:hypothetical protein